jgi:hypothetical protein
MNMFDVVKAKIKQRPEYNGRKLKESAKEFDGRVYNLEVLWLNEADEPYPGERAMQPVDDDERREWFLNGLHWIASGDVEILDNREGWGAVRRSHTCFVRFVF